jgi:hypothetical protein
MPTPNTQIGNLSASAGGGISINASNGTVNDGVSNRGSVYGVRYIKDNSTSTLQNIDSASLKNWFAEYVGLIGNFNKPIDDNTNISWGAYNNSGLLGVKLIAKNETPVKYSTNNNASLTVTPICGDVTGTSIYKVDNNVINAGGSHTFGSLNGGGSGQNPQTFTFSITNVSNGVTFSLRFTPGYDSGGAYITGTSTSGNAGNIYPFDWTDDDNHIVDSLPSYFFLGRPGNRPYGSSYN